MSRIATSRMLSVGPEEEIELLGFDYDTDSVFEIDEDWGSHSADVMRKYWSATDPLGQFWNKLETECVAACCGIDAFGLWPEELVDALQELDIQTLVKQLETVREQVLASDAQIISYHRLNYNFARESFLRLLNYLIVEVKQWM